MPKNDSLPRRTFLKQAAGAIGAASQMGRMASARRGGAKGDAGWTLRL